MRPRCSFSHQSRPCSPCNHHSASEQGYTERCGNGTDQSGTEGSCSLLHQIRQNTRPCGCTSDTAGCISLRSCIGTRTAHKTSPCSLPHQTCPGSRSNRRTSSPSG